MPWAVGVEQPIPLMQVPSIGQGEIWMAEFGEARCVYVNI